MISNPLSALSAPWLPGRKVKLETKVLKLVCKLEARSQRFYTLLLVQCTAYPYKVATGVSVIMLIEGGCEQLAH